jgi:membrane fusion protein, multidrug efflux system
MAKRMIIMISMMIAFIACIGFVKFRKIQASTGGGYQPPPEAVTTVVAREELWRGTLNAIGTVTAVNGVTVSADLPGVVQSITFASGDRVGGGQVLVRLDTRQEQAQLVAAEAKLELARLNLERVKGLREQGITPQSDLDKAVAEQKETEGMVGEIRAAIERKTIRAPFSGVLGIRQINLGQYLTSGAPIVPLQALDPIYVDFGVPQQDLVRVRTNGEVRVTLEGLAGGELKGRITAVDSVINESTRNVRIQATLDNRAGHLKPGMFVTGRVLTADEDRVIPLPSSAISYAPYGDSVFVVEQMKGPDGKPYRGVRQQFVKLGIARGDQVAVVSGIAAGAEVVSSGAFKLRNGAAVEVNNTIQPANAAAPRPEDN